MVPSLMVLGWGSAPNKDQTRVVLGPIIRSAFFFKGHMSHENWGHVAYTATMLPIWQMEQKPQSHLTYTDNSSTLLDGSRTLSPKEDSL